MKCCWDFDYLRLSTAIAVVLSLKLFFITIGAIGLYGVWCWLNCFISVYTVCSVFLIILTGTCFICFRSLRSVTFSQLAGREFKARFELKKFGGAKNRLPSLTSLRPLIWCVSVSNCLHAPTVNLKLTLFLLYPKNITFLSKLDSLPLMKLVSLSFLSSGPFAYNIILFQSLPTVNRNSTIISLKNLLISLTESSKKQ